MSPEKSAWRRIVFVFLIIASLALITVSVRESATGPVHEIRAAFGSLLAPMQSFGAQVAKPFQDGYDWLKAVGADRDRADKLQEQLDTLQNELVILQEQSEENQRLRGLLEMGDHLVYPGGTTFLVAQVITKSPSQWEAWVEVDRGSSDGMRVGQPVVGATPIVGETLPGKGLVGNVVEVYEHTAFIQLITDSQSAVAAKIQGSRAEGMVHGSLQGRLTVDYVDRDLAVEPKLVVVTSGYGAFYPADIPIGLVTSVGEETINMYKEIQVQPFVDFRVLEEVMVLIIPEGALAQPAATNTTEAGGGQ
jgi:rod shape-determining protein MreC